MVKFPNWSAEHWTAVFTGLTVIAMAIGILQNRFLTRLALAPMIPEVSVQFSRDGRIYLSVPPNSQYSIAAIQTMNRKKSLRSLAIGGTTEWGDIIEKQVDDWKRRITFPQQTKHIAFMTRHPRGDALQVFLCSRWLPTRKMPISINEIELTAD